MKTKETNYWKDSEKQSLKRSNNQLKGELHFKKHQPTYATW